MNDVGTTRVLVNVFVDYEDENASTKELYLEWERSIHFSSWKSGGLSI